MFVYNVYHKPIFLHAKANFPKINERSETEQPIQTIEQTVDNILNGTNNSNLIQLSSISNVTNNGIIDAASTTFKTLTETLRRNEDIENFSTILRKNKSLRKRQHTATTMATI